MSTARRVLGGLTILGVGSFLLFALTMSSAAPPEKESAASKRDCSCCQDQGGCCGKGKKGCCCQGGQQAREAGWLAAEHILTRLQQPAKMMASKESKAKGMAARKAVLAHQKSLRSDGVYRCCISPGCTFCSLAADMCPCAKMLAKGGPVCPECWGGWVAGKGRLPNVDPAKVKVIPRSKLRMMYMMREKMLNAAKQDGGAK